MTNIKIKIPTLKKQLQNLDKKELIQIIADLYKLNQDVKDVLNLKFAEEDAVEHLYERAKAEIEEEFFPNKGFGKLRLAKAKKAITHFKKLTGDFVKVLDLMLFYVEMGTEFTNTYGDIDEQFYYSMESMYQKVIEACEKDEQLFRQFQERLYLIVEETGGIGWGFHDYLKEVYYSSKWLNE